MKRKNIFLLCAMTALSSNMFCNDDQILDLEKHYMSVADGQDTSNKDFLESAWRLAVISNNKKSIVDSIRWCQSFMFSYKKLSEGGYVFDESELEWFRSCRLLIQELSVETLTTYFEISNSEVDEGITEQMKLLSKTLRIVEDPYLKEVARLIEIADLSSEFRIQDVKKFKKELSEMALLKDSLLTFKIFIDAKISSDILARQTINEDEYKKIKNNLLYVCSIFDRLPESCSLHKKSDCKSCKKLNIRIAKLFTDLFNKSTNYLADGMYNSGLYFLKKGNKIAASSYFEYIVKYLKTSNACVKATAKLSSL